MKSAFLGCQTSSFSLPNVIKKIVVCKRKTPCGTTHVEGFLLGKRKGIEKGRGEEGRATETKAGVGGQAERQGITCYPGQHKTLLQAQLRRSCHDPALDVPRLGIYFEGTADKKHMLKDSEWDLREGTGSRASQGDHIGSDIAQS